MSGSECLDLTSMGGCEGECLDLTTLLAAWGSNQTEADINGDGVVAAADLTLLLSGWGTCP